MKLTIISTMEGFIWGGSEELWYKTAVNALEKTYEVQVCVKKWDMMHVKLQHLQKLGANIVFKEAEVYTIANRLKKRINPHRKPEYIKSILQFQPQRILISQGGTFDTFHNPYLVDLINELKVPYSLISQFNFENGSRLEDSVCERINNIYPWEKFYFVSAGNLKSAQRQYAGVLPRTEIIDNPINLSNTALLPWPNSTTIKLACVARYDCIYKGQNILIEALSDYKDKEFVLNLYGDGPDRNYLERVIKYYGLKDRVNLKGHASNIEDIWQENHIQILASLAEGTPLSIQESMIKGRPAIANDVGDCNKLIINGITGFLCPFPSVKALSATLNQLFSTPMHQLEQMGKNAHSHILSTINLDSEEQILADFRSISS